MIRGDANRRRWPAGALEDWPANTGDPERTTPTLGRPALLRSTIGQRFGQRATGRVLGYGLATGMFLVTMAAMPTIAMSPNLQTLPG